MRRIVMVATTVLLFAALLGSIAVVILFRRSAFDAMIVPGAVGVQIERESWERARIAYTLPAPAQGVSHQLDVQLRNEGWVLSSTPTIVSSIYDPDPPPRHYFRVFGPNWMYESVFVRSFDSYGSNPAQVRVVVLRAVHWPHLPDWLHLPFIQ